MLCICNTCEPADEEMAEHRVNTMRWSELHINLVAFRGYRRGLYGFPLGTTPGRENHDGSIADSGAYKALPTTARLLHLIFNPQHATSVSLKTPAQSYSH